MDSAVDQLEAFSQPIDQTKEMVVRFCEMKVDDSLPRLFEFDPPTTCRKWPGPRFGSFCLHKPATKSTSRPKPSWKSSEKKHGMLEDVKYGVHPRKPRKATTHKPKRVKTQVPAPTISLPIASRNPPLRLMDLPAEVRNDIWTLLAVRKDPIEAQYRLIQPCKRGQVVTRRFPQEPPLAAASKQLRKEVLSLFYGLNKFVFETSASAALKDLDMTNISKIQKWKPRADMASFISQVDIRLMKGGPGSMLIVYEIRHKANANLIINVTYGVNKKKAVSGSRPMCLCEDEAIAQFEEDHCGREDLVETVVALLKRRTEVFSTPALLRGGICKRCRLGVSKL